MVTAFRGMHVSHAKHNYMHDYQESVTTGQTDRQTETRTDGQTDTPDTVVPMCRYASQATQNPQNWILWRHCCINKLLTVGFVVGATHWLILLCTQLLASYAGLPSGVPCKSRKYFQYCDNNFNKANAPHIWQILLSDQNASLLAIWPCMPYVYKHL